MRHERVRRGRSTLVGLSLQIRRTTKIHGFALSSLVVGCSTPCVQAKRFRWAFLRRTVLACTTCTGTFGSGCRTARTGITRVRRVTAGHGKAGIAPAAFCVGAPGGGVVKPSVPRTDLSATPAATAATMAFVWRGCSDHDSSPFHIPLPAPPPRRREGCLQCRRHILAL